MSSYAVQGDEGASKTFHHRAPAPAMPWFIEIGNLTTKGTKEHQGRQGSSISPLFSMGRYFVSGEDAEEAQRKIEKAEGIW